MIRDRLWQFLLLGLVVSLLLGAFADAEAAVAAFAAFEWTLLPLAVAATLGNQLCRFLKWEYLLRRVGVELPTGRSVQIFGSGLVMILTPGKVGEVWKSWLVRDTTGTPVARTVPVVAVERLTDTLGVAAVGLVGVVAFGRSPALFAGLAALLVGGVLAVRSERVVYGLLSAAGRLPVVGDRTDRLERLYRQSRHLLSVRSLLVTWLLSVASWVLEGLGLWVIVAGFGAEISPTAAAFVFAVSSVLGAASLLPGGLGVAEGSITGLLLVFGLERAMATSATLVVRATLLWFVVALALLAYGTLIREDAVTAPEETDERLLDRR